MKLGRFYLFTLFILVGWNNLFAQSVTFSDLRLEHNVPDNYGRRMLQFHYNMTVTGCQGHNVKAYMFVDIPQGTGHRFANGNNMVVSSNSLYCKWGSTTTTGDWWVGIYNDQLNPLPGKNTYYTRLWVKDENTGKWIGCSDFLSFENTGSDRPVAYNNYNYNNSQNNMYSSFESNNNKREQDYSQRKQQRDEKAEQYEWERRHGSSYQRTYDNWYETIIDVKCKSTKVKDWSPEYRKQQLRQAQSKCKEIAKLYKEKSGHEIPCTKELLDWNPSPGDLVGQ